MSTADRVLAALASYSLERVKPGEYKLNSPLRAGSNSHAFTLTIEDDEHGAWYDFPAGEGGSLYQLAERLGIEVERARPEQTKRTYVDASDYAAAHGLTVEQLTAAHWLPTTKDGRPALEFVTDTGKRWRFLDDRKPHYISEPGYKACWYGLKKAVKLAKAGNHTIVLCNGEISTVAAHSRGIPAACVTSGEKAIPEALLRELNAAWSGEILLAYDCDKTGQATAVKIAGQLPNAKMVDLRFPPDSGGDLADFVRLHGDTAFDELRKQVVVTPKVEVAPQGAAMLAQQVAELKKAIRDKQKDEAGLAHLIEEAQSTIDQIAMGVAAPKLLSFTDLASAAEAEAEVMRGTPGALIGFHLGKRPTGFPALAQTMGGVPADLITILGATGSGKSWTVVSLVRELLEQMSGLIVSTEMAPLTWFKRLVASKAGANYKEFRHGQSRAEEWKRLQAAMADYGLRSAQILNHPAPTPRMVRLALEQMLNSDSGCGWVVVDSASKMSAAGEIYQRMNAVADGLQNLARDFEMPVIATLQTGTDMSSAGRRGKRMPQKEDAYGGSPMMQNSGAVLGLYNHSYYVKLGLEDPNPEFEIGQVMVRVLKLREEDDSTAPIYHWGWTGAGYQELETKTVSLKSEA